MRHSRIYCLVCGLLISSRTSLRMQQTIAMPDSRSRSGEAHPIEAHRWLWLNPTMTDGRLKREARFQGRTRPAVTGAAFNLSSALNVFRHSLLSCFVAIGRFRSP